MRFKKSEFKIQKPAAGGQRALFGSCYSVRPYFSLPGKVRMTLPMLLWSRKTL